MQTFSKSEFYILRCRQVSILKDRIVILSCVCWIAWGLVGGASLPAAESKPPNIVVFMCDNLGYGDIGPYGSKLHRTPNLDALAQQGRKFTHFYTSASVCTASRAGLMVGAYAQRVNLIRNIRGGAVLQPGEPIGLHPEEVTVAEILRDAGYATMLIGKWHLGDQPAFLPTRQGFDRYWGVPYSDDMTPREGFTWPPLPLMQDEVVIEAPVDRNELTRRETEQAISFIRENREQPFMLIVSHAMPGSTQASFASEAFRGKSRNGLYGDAVEELDWSAGQTLQAIDDLGLAENTLVIWTCDNSAPRRNPQQGSNAPLSGYMNDTQEGSFRVPFIARWLGRIPAGTVCDELITMMDLLPTFAQLAGAKMPTRKIDGKNIWPLLAGEPAARTPHEAFYYYRFEQLRAVRSGNWKLFLPLEQQPARLYDVVSDVSESQDVAEAHPEVIARLSLLAEAAREELGDRGKQGSQSRPAGWVFQADGPRLR
jgi:arylsulfatase A